MKTSISKVDTEEDKAKKKIKCIEDNIKATMIEIQLSRWDITGNGQVHAGVKCEKQKIKRKV